MTDELTHTRTDGQVQSNMPLQPSKLEQDKIVVGVGPLLGKHSGPKHAYSTR